MAERRERILKRSGQPKGGGAQRDVPAAATNGWMHNPSCLPNAAAAFTDAGRGSGPIVPRMLPARVPPNECGAPYRAIALSPWERGYLTRESAAGLS